MAKAKKTIRQRVADLKIRLDRSEKKLKDIINKIATSTQTSSAYWNQIQKEVVKIYEEFRTTWTQFANTEIPIEYRDAIREQIAYVKGLKFKPPVNLDYRTFINTNINVQSISSVVGESIESFFIAIEGGEREINRLLRATQQNLVNEKAVNKAIDKGLFEKGTTFQAKKELEKTLLKKMLDEKFVTIIDKNGKTRFYNIKSYAEMVARTKIREAQTIGVANTAIAYGTDLVQVSSHNTETPFDAQFEGLIFSLSGNDPNFPKATFLPPFHPNCYSEDTDIYTKRGWINFKHITKDDLFLSLIPKSHKIEFVKCNKLIKYKTSEDLINFKSRRLDLLVTKNHRMYYQTDWNSKHNKNVWKFEKADNLYNKKSGRFFSGCVWDGNEIDKNYCEFMGWYLSEGSVEKISENGYKIIISQSRKKNCEKYEKIVKCLKKVFPNKHLCCMKESIVVYDKEMGSFLLQFGKSYEKYIPDNIMNANKECIDSFLEAFCLGDGSKGKGKIFKGHKFQNYRIYFTSSKKMADQISELILKIGRRPSFWKKKGEKTVKHRNGIYKTKHDCYKIAECNSLHYSMQNIKTSYVKYNDYVYCVELEKNNIVLVRRNNKILWSGNCLHSITIVFSEVLERRGVLDKMIEKSNVKINTDLK